MALVVANATWFSMRGFAPARRNTFLLLVQEKSIQKRRTPNVTESPSLHSQNPDESQLAREPSAHTGSNRVIHYFWILTGQRGCADGREKHQALYFCLRPKADIQHPSQRAAKSSHLGTLLCMNISRDDNTQPP